jgi:outer membrane receptor protein involved in Fe transport
MRHAGLVRRALLAAGTWSGVTGPGEVHALSPPAPAPCSTAALPAAEADRTGPLGRTVSLRAREVSLREALDRIAARARIRLSYSAEVLPLDRRVCVQFDSVTVGAALASVLGTIPVRLVPLGADHVVLAPVAGETAGRDPPPVELERIVVTGSVAGASQSGLPVALDVLAGRDLEQRGAATIGSAFNGGLAGVWVWEQSPLSALSQYGSIRGASSFGASYPKVYLDGIQLANPLLLTRIQSSAIDRIELIRGPQGAALYGADAISGVANITSRFDTGENGARARIDAGVGLAGSSYSANPALEQAYGLRLRTGSNLESASLNVDAGSTGSYFADTYSRRIVATAVGRRVGERSILTGTLRVFGMRAGTAESPVITRTLASWRANNPGSELATPSRAVESLGQYTLGATYRWFAGERWQHSFTAGIDGYGLSGVPDQRTPIPLTGIASLRDAEGSATRGTVRASSVLRLGPEERAADLTFSLEQSVLRERAVPDQVLPYYSSGFPRGSGAADSQVTRWRGNTGVSAQLNTTVRGGLHLSGGVRVERDEGAAGTGRWATLPMAGVAWVRQYGRLGLKLRGAYGKGIRWPEVPARETLWEGLRPQSASRTLEPEEQSGVEAGLDLVVGRTLTFQVTRFDQVASGLIQRVGLARDTGAHPMRPPAERLAFELQNVGEITNRGWEVQGSLRHGGFALSSAFSQVNSRVRKVAAGYTGDLRAGDRMLEVPARTLSVAGSYTASRWNASITAYRAYDWINYDRVALAQAFATTDRAAHDYVGWRLREFWKAYPGVTRLRAGLGYTLTPNLGFSLTGDNLLNHQTGEPDNITVLPGRTLSVGFRTSF